MENDKCRVNDTAIHFSLIKAWLQFFRVPNLPTAPGDALVGASFVLMAQNTFALGSQMSGLSTSVFQAFMAAGASLLVYMFGLADNDIVGAQGDVHKLPLRPIPAGLITLTQARIARFICLLIAGGLGYVALLPWAWWICLVLLVGCVMWYNRTKGVWLMGMCRALSVASGALGCGLSGMINNANNIGLILVVAVLATALGCMLYVAAITLLSEGEESESEGLGNRRYVLGLAALSPAVLTALAFCFLPIYPIRFALLMGIGCLWAFVLWCAAVAPLWMAHKGVDRQRAVGQVVGAILPMQLGYLFAVPNRSFWVAAIVLWLLARFIHRIFPNISGS